MMIACHFKLIYFIIGLCVSYLIENCIVPLSGINVNGVHERQCVPSSSCVSCTRGSAGKLLGSLAAKCILEMFCCLPALGLCRLCD